MIFENLSTCFAKISVINFQNSKIWDVHFLCFSMLIVMWWFWFAVSYIFSWQIGLENDVFSSIFILIFFWKISQRILLIFKFKNIIYEKIKSVSKKIQSVLFVVVYIFLTKYAFLWEIFGPRFSSNWGTLRPERILLPLFVALTSL